MQLVVFWRFKIDGEILSSFTHLKLSLCNEGELLRQNIPGPVIAIVQIALAYLSFFLLETGIGRSEVQVFIVSKQWVLHYTNRVARHGNVILIIHQMVGHALIAVKK